MAIFMLGVAIGWVATFAIWFAAPFSLFASFALGTFSGLVASFALLMLFRSPWSDIALQRPDDVAVSKD